MNRKTEYVVVSFSALLLFCILIWADAFEQVAQFTRSHENWELDEFFILLPVVILMLSTVMVLEWRRVHRLNTQLRQEIRHRSEAENRLLAQKKFTDSILTSIQDGICILNTDLTIRHANPVIENWYPDSVLHEGRCCFQAFRNLSEPCDDCPALACIRTGKTTRKIIKHRGGSPIEWVEIFCYPMREGKDDQITGVVEFCRNITDRKKAEEKSAALEKRLLHTQKMESIGTLASGIAHDFNNILSGIFGYVQLAEKHKDDSPKLISHLGHITEGARRAAALIQQILTFSRQSDTRKKALPLDTIVREALDLIRSSLPATIEICHNLSCKASVLANATQIHQVVMNLCTNAWHAMEKCPGTLSVTLSTLDQIPDDPASTSHRNGYVCLSIEDTGTGIPPEIKEKIFDPYFTTKAPDEGTGLGLATVYGIVKDHRGQIRVSSTPGKGTRFDLFFPVLDGQRPATRAPKREGTQPQRTQGSTIYLVDDEQSILSSL